MPSAKLPLFNGIPLPLHNALGSFVLNSLGGPIDKTLQPEGVQAFYEIHLWLVPRPKDSACGWKLAAVYDAAPTTGLISQGQYLAANSPNYPIKILDGYPVRGDVTLILGIQSADVADEYPFGAQVYGYAYRVGQGALSEPERRFIGAPSIDGIAAGVPLLLAPKVKTKLHTFEKNHLDEISLDFQPDAAACVVDLYFEDASNVSIIPGQKITFAIPQLKGSNALRDPQSMYVINKAVFGPNTLTTLDHISIESDLALYVHGYFTRR